MPRWVPAIEAAGVRAGFGRYVRVDGRALAVFNDGGAYYTVDDACPHQGASLGEGFLHDGCVVCPWHSWKFDVRTGVCPRAPHVSVASYPTRLIGSTVEVQLPDESSRGAPNGSDS